MTLLEAITEGHLLAKGKATAPGSTTSTYLALKSFAGVVQRMWQDEPDVQWDSLRVEANVSGTVTATDTFTLPVTIREISKREDDYVTITLGTAVYYYTVVSPRELTMNTRAGIRVVAQQGRSLIFSIPFLATDPQFGGTITVPGYGYVTTLVDETSSITVDEPLYVTLMMAAEFCRTKTSLVYRVDALVERASQVMMKMKQNQTPAATYADAPNLAVGRSW